MVGMNIICSVQENIHTPSTEASEILGGGFLKEKRVNLNFQRGRGGRRKNPFFRGGLDIFCNYTFPGTHQK